MSFEDCTVSGNQAVWHGGGLFVDTGGVVTVLNSFFSANRASWDGGGAYICGATASFISSAYNANTAVGQSGTYSSDLFASSGCTNPLAVCQSCAPARCAAHCTMMLPEER